MGTKKKYMRLNMLLHAVGAAKTHGFMLCQIKNSI
jgi:hypothetical protein